jgi:small subunit ribosomal protein S13
MPRISGVDIPPDKPVRVSLRYIYGIGPALADVVLNKVGINGQARAKDLTDEELGRIAAAIDADYVTEGRLKRQIAQNINRLKEIKCYRGLRHMRGLPVRGQRTQTNARTRKGPRKVVATKKSIKQMR